MALDYNPFENDQAPNSLVLRKNRVKVHQEPPPLPEEEFSEINAQKNTETVTINIENINQEKQIDNNSDISETDVSAVDTSIQDTSKTDESEIDASSLDKSKLDTSVTDTPKLDISSSDNSDALNSLPLDNDSFIGVYGKPRRNWGLEKAIAKTMRANPILAESRQTKLLERIWSKGWGRYPHALSRLIMKASAHNLTLREISIITTVYDATLAQVRPKMFHLFGAIDIESKTGIHRSHVSPTLAVLEKKQIILRIKLSEKGWSFLAINPDSLNTLIRDEKQTKTKKAKPDTSNSDTSGTAPSDADTSKEDTSYLSKLAATANIQGSSQKNAQVTDTTAKSSTVRTFQEACEESLSQHTGFNERWDNLPKRTREREIGIIKFFIEKFPDDTQELFDEIQRLETTRLDHFGKPCGSPIGLIESSWPTIRAIRQEKRQKEEITKGKESEKQAQKTQEERVTRIRTLEEQVQAETDVMVLEHYDNLTEEEEDVYLARVHEQNKSSGFKAAKGTPAAKGLIKELIREDLKLHEYEVRKLAELSLQQSTATT